MIWRNRSTRQFVKFVPPKLTYNIVPFLDLPGCPGLPDVHTLAAGVLQLGHITEESSRVMTHLLVQDKCEDDVGLSECHGCPG